MPVPVSAGGAHIRACPHLHITVTLRGLNSTPWTCEHRSSLRKREGSLGVREHVSGSGVCRTHSHSDSGLPVVPVHRSSFCAPSPLRSGSLQAFKLHITRAASNTVRPTSGRSNMNSSVIQYSVSHRRPRPNSSNQAIEAKYRITKSCFLFGRVDGRGPGLGRTRLSRQEPYTGVY